MSQTNTKDVAADVHVRKTACGGVTLKSVTATGPCEVQSLHADPAEDKVVTSVVFGRSYECASWGDSSGFPVTRVLEKDATAMSGAHLYVVENAEVRPITLGDRTVGAVYEDPYARYCYLGDIRPEDPSAPRTDQAARVFELIEEALSSVGMDFHNVARTWFYLDKILEWYTEFNAVRSEFFTKRGVFDGLVPASTGIGGHNPAGTALMTEVFAVQPTSENVSVQAIPSPLQCPALEYGSSFSRAVEIGTPDCRQLLVSGTASIEPGGKTEYVGDAPAQIDLTMRVVGAILESRQMGWSDTTRAVAYFQKREDIPAFYDYCAANGLADLPVIVVNNDVCRDDLLFEVELDAAAIT